MISDHPSEFSEKLREFPCFIIVIGPSDRFLSGISYFTQRLANALAQDTNRVAVLLFRDMLPAKLFPGWRRIGKDLSSGQYSDRVEKHEILDWYNPLTWIAAASHARRGDIVIIEWWTSSVAHMYLAVEFLIAGQRPIIIEFHEVVDPLEQSIWLIRLYAKFMGRMIRGLATGYVVHSAEDRDLIASHYGVRADRIATIPHGLYDQYPHREKDEVRNRLGIREEYCVLFFGLMRPYKGVIYLIEAFEALPEPILSRARLLIVGEAWEDTESIARAGQSPVHEQITIVDRYVSDDEISLYFSAADVLVIPYTRASQSGVAHIGMAFGLPIIASRVGGMSESLSTYSGTKFVEPANPGQLAASLQEAYGERGRQYPPPEELRWERIAEKWRDLCRSIVR